MALVVYFVFGLRVERETNVVVMQHGKMKELCVASSQLRF